MIDILGLDSLFAEMITGLGLALLVGNLLAWRKHAKGERPAGVVGEFRRGRVTFLLVVGLLMTVWGVASILNGNPDSGSADSGSQAAGSWPGPDWKSLW
jgi:hypothetical protein